MKKLVILPALILVGLYGHATTFIITVSNNQFSPANIPNVVVGDVLQFNFALEKSTDGKNYKEAGRVTATGEGGTQQSYTYRDDRLDMNAKYIYYMLRMVDKDGSYELSPVKLVRNEQAVNKLITQIGPNPV